MKPHGWLDRALIPNTDGYRLTLLLHDGQMVTTSVQRGADGMHLLKTISIGQVAGWRAVKELGGNRNGDRTSLR